MSFPDLRQEQQKIVRALYNEWQARPTGLGLHEQDLAKQTGIELNELVKEIQRLKGDGLVESGEGTDDDQLGFVWLTNSGRSLYEG
jgi:DNA-binding MarR family transcriptional regulator